MALLCILMGTGAALAQQGERISFDVKDCYKWHDYLLKKGVSIVSEVEKSKHGHTFFFIKDCDGNLIELIDLKYRYPLLRHLGWLGGWLFRRGMYKEHYG